MIKIFKKIIFVFICTSLGASNNAIFIPDNLETNVFYQDLSFATDDNLFSNAVLYVKKCLDLLSIDYSEFDFNKMDVLYSSNGSILTILFKESFFSFYQEGQGNTCGRRSLFRDLHQYENVFVFENSEKFKGYKSFKKVFSFSRLYYEFYDQIESVSTLKRKTKPLFLRFNQEFKNFIFCFLDVKNVFFLPKEYYSDFFETIDSKVKLNLERIISQVEIKATTKTNLHFSLLPGDFNFSSDNVRKRNLTFLDYICKNRDLIEILPDFRIYKEGGKDFCGRRLLIRDLNQEPYFFRLYSFEPKNVFLKKIPWFSGFNLSYFNDIVFFEENIPPIELVGYF
jgi:hypothetical protein